MHDAYVHVAYSSLYMESTVSLDLGRLLHLYLNRPRCPCTGEDCSLVHKESSVSLYWRGLLPLYIKRARCPCTEEDCSHCTQGELDVFVLESIATIIHKESAVPLYWRGLLP
jgi:hypothetical protein